MCQREDGSTGDQGGAAGLQGGIANEITKVWMSMLEADVMIDYLLRKGKDEEIEKFLLKRAEFVLNSQIYKDGKYYWAYQYKYGENPGDPWDMMAHPETYHRHPVREMVNGYKARFLTFMTLLTGDKKYLEAWQRCYDTFIIDYEHFIKERQKGKIHWYTQNKFVQNLPFEISHTINAKWEDGILKIKPVITEVNPVLQGEISTPEGKVKLEIKKTQNTIEIKTESEKTFPVSVDIERKKLNLTSNDLKTIFLKKIKSQTKV
jgi:hypothetical protein